MELKKRKIKINKQAVMRETRDLEKLKQKEITITEN